MALKITEVDPKTLIQDPENVRKHDDRNRETVRRSIQKYGLRKPIVAHEGSNIVYAGNLTLEVALEMEMKAIPVAWIPESVSVATCRAYAIADNRSSEQGAWDYDLLEESIKQLGRSPNFDTLDIGFNELEINQIMSLNEQPTIDHDEIWQGMPEFEQEDKSGIKLIVHFEKQEDKQAFAELVGQKLTEKTKFIWFPEKESIKPSNLAYEQENDDE